MDIHELLPIPDIFDCKRLLCVQPHPDDMDVSAGGTIARLAQQGTEVIYLTVTDDTAGFADTSMEDPRERRDLRRREQEAAGEMLGVKEYRWLDFPDAGDWSVYDARNRIMDQIRDLRPDFVMTVDPWLLYEAHRDHVKTGRAACEALVMYNMPFINTGIRERRRFEPFDIMGLALVWSNRPNTVVDATGTRELKLAAIAAHRSQFDPAFLELFTAYDLMRGQKAAEGKGFGYGEPFKVLHPQYMLHSFPEAADY
ncbi:MAG TPA: PIG-L family deacetylase [Spirochaetes bacterium]|nr:PIG-L family deacetylase [Spirochaetota bacterium]